MCTGSEGNETELHFHSSIIINQCQSFSDKTGWLEIERMMYLLTIKK
jgi:hypothetical protein